MSNILMQFVESLLTRRQSSFEKKVEEESHLTKLIIRETNRKAKYEMLDKALARASILAQDKDFLPSILTNLCEFLEDKHIDATSKNAIVAQYFAYAIKLADGKDRAAAFGLAALATSSNCDADSLFAPHFYFEVKALFEKKLPQNICDGFALCMDGGAEAKPHSQLDQFATRAARETIALVPAEERKQMLIHAIAVANRDGDLYHFANNALRNELREERCARPTQAKKISGFSPK